MTQPTQEDIAKRMAEEAYAVAPLNTIAVEDVGKAARIVDQWLKDISHDVVTLDRVMTVAGSLPVLGNIIALVDVLCDIIAIVTKKSRDEVENFFNWVSLGINLIGVVPVPGTAAARTSLRPALHLVREKFKTSAHDIGEAVVVMLIGHLNATLAGSIDLYIDEAIAKLEGVLGEAGDKAEAMIGNWSGGLRKLAAGRIFEDSPVPPKPMRNPGKQYSNFLAAAYGAMTDKAAAARAEANRLMRQGGNAGFSAALNRVGASKLLIQQAEFMEVLKGQVKARIQAQGRATEQKSIAWLLEVLQRSVRRMLPKLRKNGKNLSPDHVAEHKLKHPDAEIDASRNQAMATGNPGCKECPAKSTTGRSISFATGSETLVQTDFALPGQMPIVWSRLYHSRLAAYDHPVHLASQTPACAYLGARWTTAYTTRIEQARDGSLVYFAADGRDHKFPRLPGPDDGQVGQTHHNPIEDLTLGRGNDGLLILSHGRHYVETFELAPQFIVDGKAATQKKAVFYRLASQRDRAGHTTTLAYRHAGGQLSDIVSGETHVSTAIDARGRIQSLWLVEGDQAVRQLASYTFEDQADGSSDLIAAQDEDQNSWTYEYLQAGKDSTHLISRYTDRTERGIKLQWMHADGFDTAITPANSGTARAYREQADDGSFATTIVWNNNIRLTTVIDALGNEKRYYYDILGYTYRIVYPAITAADGKIYEHEEWFFRDANKNVTVHVHPDGGKDLFCYDAQSNLLAHTRADGSTVHFAHDELDNLTGILDAEGNRWERSYDGINLVEEVNPLGHSTAYAYNQHGQPVEITDAKGGKKQLAYNAAGQLTAYTDCSGKTTTWAYDDRGRLIKLTNAAGEATSYAYQRGNLAVVTHPDNTREHLEHDAEGRLLLHRDALQRETHYRYSEAGFIAQRTDANKNTLQYQWDRLGRLVELQNENTRSHRFQYDPLGKLIAETSFDDSRTDYLYTPANGVLRQIEEASSLTQLDFDAMGRLTERKVGLYGVKEDPEDGNTSRVFDPASIQVDRYAYDGNGRLVDARNQNIHLQWFHDAAGNTRTEHHHYQIDAEGNPDAAPMTAVWQHRYDELGTRIQTTRPDGHTTRWLTYGSGHVHGLMLDDIEALQIERDDIHRETKRTQANQIAEERQYDPAGRLKAQILSRAEPLGQSAGSTRFAPAQVTTAFSLKRSYRYDQAGQLTDIGDSRRGALSYRYDPVGRLLQANARLGTETFAFDPASNIVDPQALQTPQGLATSGPRINGIPAILDNLLRDYAGTHFDYDDRGNMVRRTHNGQVTHFRWSAGNQLLQVTDPGVRTTRYHYDPLGRRIAKHTVPLGQSQQLPTEDNQWGATLFGWDGDQMAWEADYARRLTVHYVFEPNSFVPLLQASSQTDIRKMFLERPDVATSEYVDDYGSYTIDLDPLYNGEYIPGFTEAGNPPAPLRDFYYYQCDHLGTPMELTDEQGSIAWEANYKAWGEAKITVSEAARKAKLKNPIRFQGQYFDEESGLHYNRFRYYDPVSGRFISNDPIRLMGGINLHQYAPNPMEWIDPLGLTARLPCLICCDGSHGRSNKQERLRALADDPLQPRAVRGWIRNEQRHIETGNRKTIRLPGNSRNSRTPGMELAHGRETEAKDGYCYRHSELQDADLHKTQHQIGGY